MSTALLERRESDTLTPLERLEALCDPGSLQLFRTRVTSDALGDRARPGDGVVAGAGTVGGRPVACYAEDGSFLGGSLGAAHAETIVRLTHMAGKARMPIVGFIHSGGARLQEGTAALAGYGDIFAGIVGQSGHVPQISVVTGTSAGGGAYAPALTDFVIMTQSASMFLTGPGIVREVMGEDVDVMTLGGPRVQGANGVCDLVVPTDLDAVYAARALLDHLPQHAGGPLPSHDADPAPGEDPGDVVPDSPRKVYDVRQVIARMADGGRLLEVGERWARNVVCAFARIEGRPVGFVANQPRHLGGVLDAESAQKAARFVRTCHLFGVPLVALVDTPGFLPGTRQEAAGVIRHGAKLVHAFAEAAVPKVTVVLRKSFGGAHIAMNSRQLGAHLVFAWPEAKIGVMGPQQAVGLIHRREIAGSEDPAAARERLALDYAEEHLGADRAAQDGVVDEVIEPADTRSRLAWSLRTLAGVPHDGGHARNLPL